MAVKKILTLGLMLFSFGAHAIPPAPPEAIYNKIKTFSASNCLLENGTVVTDLNDTERVKFVLQLNKKATNGILTMIEDGLVVENFKVTCE